jgi:hypothetical protein
MKDAPRQRLEVSSRLRAPVSLPPAVPIGQEVGWTPEPVWTISWSYWDSSPSVVQWLYRLRYRGCTKFRIFLLLCRFSGKVFWKAANRTLIRSWNWFLSCFGFRACTNVERLRRAQEHQPGRASNFGPPRCRVRGVSTTFSTLNETLNHADRYYIFVFTRWAFFFQMGSLCPCFMIMITFNSGARNL